MSILMETGSELAMRLRESDRRLMAKSLDRQSPCLEMERASPLERTLIIRQALQMLAMFACTMSGKWQRRSSSQLVVMWGDAVIFLAARRLVAQQNLTAAHTSCVHPSLWRIRIVA